MDNRYINKVLEELNPLLTEQGFKETDGVYKNDKKDAANHPLLYLLIYF